MPIDLSNYKVPVFPNINDVPTAPTVNKAGNGADLVNRINGLIDELAVLLEPANSTLINWTMRTSPSTDYADLEIYYVGTGERYIYKSVVVDNALLLTQFDLIKRYVFGVDIEANQTIDISEIITQRGVGFYFFLARKADGTVKPGSAAFPLADPYTGSVTQLDENIYYAATNDKYNSGNQILGSALAVRYLVPNFAILLLDESPVIG